MSINPVPAIGPVSDAHSADIALRSQPVPSAVAEENSGPPDPGSRPTQEVRIPQNVPVSPVVPEDEVQVQRDNEVNDEIVIKYVDHEGNLILQVPSSEVLDLARAIGEDFQQQARARAVSSTSGNEGDKAHGH